MSPVIYRYWGTLEHGDHPAKAHRTHRFSVGFQGHIPSYTPGDIRIIGREVYHGSHSRNVPGNPCIFLGLNTAYCVNRHKVA